MGIAAAIITGVLAVGTAVYQGASASAAASEEEQRIRSFRKLGQERFKKQFKQEQRQTNLGQLSRLAEQRFGAQKRARSKMFNRGFMRAASQSRFKPPGAGTTRGQPPTQQQPVQQNVSQPYRMAA